MHDVKHPLSARRRYGARSKVRSWVRGLVRDSLTRFMRPNAETPAVMEYAIGLRHADVKPTRHEVVYPYWNLREAWFTQASRPSRRGNDV